MRKLPIKSHLLSAAIFLPVVIFTAISVYYIACFHVWSLSRDQWHMYAPYFDHGLWQAALTPMSTHRHLFPFLFFHVDMAFFGGRNHFLVFSGTLFNILIIILLLRCLKNEVLFSTREKQCLSVLIIMMLVWLLNIAQLGWGFMSIDYYLAIFTYLFSIFSAYQYQHTTVQKQLWLATCIGCGIICTFSFGMGILIWPSLLFFFWIWRSPLYFFSAACFALLICLAVFFLLPGGGEIESALLFQPEHAFKFVMELAGGPIYYLLKSYRFIDADISKTIAANISIIVTTLGVVFLAWILCTRTVLSVFFTLCCALMIVGLGTATLITFTRSPYFLDVWVDRYQIWATLFWLGFLPLCYQQFKKYLSTSRVSNTLLLFFMCALPVVAFPSQLDMGARLAEYNIRVRQALLFYQLGIPDKQAAEDALHWNWENKLPYFFSVLQQIKGQHKNIYYSGYYDYLGLPIDELLKGKTLRNIDIHIKTTSAITQNELLDLHNIPSATAFINDSLLSSQTVVGYKIFAKVPENMHWQHAVFVGENGIINGIGVNISHSLLPRGNFSNLGKDYNFFAIVRNANVSSGLRAGKIRCYLFDRIDSNTVLISTIN